MKKNIFINKNFLLTLLFALAFISVQMQGQQNLVYGQTYYLQNGWNNYSGGYLDVNGKGCQSNHLCVSTNSEKKEGESSAWIILSSDGNKNGQAVAMGDQIRLQSAWEGGNGGYLGIRGYGIYYADNPGFVCVSTWLEPTSDGATNWKITSASSDGYVKDLTDVSLQNQWSGASSYLDTNGEGCNNGYKCVSGAKEKNRDNGSGNWKFSSFAKTTVGTGASMNPCDLPVGTYYYDSEKDFMERGDRVYTGKVLSSSNGKFFALMTDEGKLTMNKVTNNTMCAGGIMLYLDHAQTWEAPSQRGPAGEGGYLELQSDGNLCMRDKNGKFRWCAPKSLGAVKVDINEQDGCLQAWSNTELLWSSCEN